MPTLIVYQFNSSVTDRDVQKLRRSLHDMEVFRICEQDAAQMCLELPSSAVLCAVDDPGAAKGLFELELSRYGLLSSLDIAFYVETVGRTVFKSTRICQGQDGCEF